MRETRYSPCGSLVSSCYVNTERIVSKGLEAELSDQVLPHLQI